MQKLIKGKKYQIQGIKIQFFFGKKVKERKNQQRKKRRLGSIMSNVFFFCKN